MFSTDILFIVLTKTPFQRKNPLQKICKALLQPIIEERTQQQQKTNKQPEASRQIWFLPEPDMLYKAIAVTFYKIIDGIDLKKHMNRLRKNAQIPGNGRTPHTNQKYDANNLIQIPEEYNDRCKKQRYCKQQTYRTD